MEKLLCPALIAASLCIHVCIFLLYPFFNCLVFQAFLPPLRSKGGGAIWPPLPPPSVLSNGRGRTFSPGVEQKVGLFRCQSGLFFFLSSFLSLPFLSPTPSVWLPMLVRRRVGKEEIKEKGREGKVCCPFSLSVSPARPLISPFLPPPPSSSVFFCLVAHFSFPFLLPQICLSSS